MITAQIAKDYILSNMHKIVNATTDFTYKEVFKQVSKVSNGLNPLADKSA